MHQKACYQALKVPGHVLQSMGRFIVSSDRDKNEIDICAWGGFERRTQRRKYCCWGWWLKRSDSPASRPRLMSHMSGPQILQPPVACFRSQIHMSHYAIFKMHIKQNQCHISTLSISHHLLACLLESFHSTKNRQHHQW